MPLFCGDYLKDTTDLTLEEHGAFMMILMITWATGGKPLPDDDARMAKRLSIPRDRWVKKLKPVLSQFFDLSGGTWRNERLEREWAYVQEVIAKRREAGAKGGRAPKNGPNGPNSRVYTSENFSENYDANPRKNNETSKANGSAELKQNGSTHPHTSAYAETFADAKGAGAPSPGNVVQMPLTAEGELFGPVLADLVAAVPDVVPREIRAMLGKAKGHFGPDAALSLAKQALLRAEPWSWLCATINARINLKPAAGGRPIEAGARELLDKLAAMRGAL
jgi:uncharacterized protein YdaU (DUF1376 family)